MLGAARLSIAHGHERGRKQLSAELTRDKARIFRITHRDNVPWIIRNGLHCSTSRTADANFVSIGNPDLIEKRTERKVPNSPGKTLADYIPFYFTPYSPMLLNICTGWGGIQKRQNSEIVILVSSLLDLAAKKVRYVFTDRHAYLATAQYFTSLEDLDRVDWDLIQSRDFKWDSNDPGKQKRYMAEALVEDYLPVGALLGIACFDDETKKRIERDAASVGVKLKVIAKPGWYFG